MERASRSSARGLLCIRAGTQVVSGLEDPRIGESPWRSAGMGTYNVDEIFQFAVRIEEKGEEFYRKMSEQFRSEKQVADLFSRLAEQEVDHRIFFQKILNSFASYPPESFNEEYFLYVRAFADNAIFSEEKLNQEREKIGEIDDALKFAMDRELDSVNYYHGLRELVDGDDQEKIDRIIEEERKHFLQLHRMRKELTG